MRVLRREWMRSLLAPVIALGLAAGCTKYNPTTGQSEIDYGATAGVAGAAMGAAALGVALSNNDDDRHYYGGPGYYGGRGGYHGGGRGHNTVNIDRDINVNKNVNASHRKVNAGSARVNKASRAGARSGGRPHRRS